MAHTTTRRKAARLKPAELTRRTALERARLKRLLRTRNGIITIVGQLRRANDKCNALMLALARDIAADHGGKVVVVVAVPLQEAAHVAPGS